MLLCGTGNIPCFLPEEHIHPHTACTPCKIRVTAMPSPGIPDSVPQIKRLNENVERFVDFVLRDRKRVEAGIHGSVDIFV